MAALASTTDYEALTGQTLDDAELARVSRLLELASDAVLAGAHGQLIESTVYEDATLYNHEGAFYFPQRPVTAVASVEVGGVTYSAGDYRFTSGGNGRPAMLIRRVSGYDARWGWHDGSARPYYGVGSEEATVTYTAGWATVPAQIIAAVVAVARGAYMGSADTVLTATAAGAFVPEYPGSNLNLVAMKLTPAVQAVVDQLCKVRPPGSVEIGRG